MAGAEGEVGEQWGKDQCNSWGGKFSKCRAGPMFSKCRFTEKDLGFSLTNENTERF